MVTHSNILAWESPWTVEPGGLQSMGSHRSGMTEQLYPNLLFKVSSMYVIEKLRY